jgi:hypothetical protein
LQGYNYICYWGACMLVTLLAALTALSELAAIRRQSQREQHQLVEDTFKNAGSDPFGDESQSNA